MHSPINDMIAKAIFLNPFPVNPHFMK